MLVFRLNKGEHEARKSREKWESGEKALKNWWGKRNYSSEGAWANGLRIECMDFRNKVSLYEKVQDMNTGINCLGRMKHKSRNEAEELAL